MFKPVEFDQFKTKSVSSSEIPNKLKRSIKHTGGLCPLFFSANRSQLHYNRVEVMKLENNFLTEDITLRQLILVLSLHQEVEVLVEDEHVFKGPCKYLLVEAVRLGILNYDVAEVLVRDGVLEIIVTNGEDE